MPPTHETARAEDFARRFANLLLAIGQPVTTYLVFRGTDFNASANRGGSDPPIVPAMFAFPVIWSLVYLGCIAYGVYQALPASQPLALLRRLGPWTASAFLSTCIWLVAARQDHIWATVAIIILIALSLAGAMRAIVRHERSTRPLTGAALWLVKAPLGLFAGWISVAVFANTAAAMKASGWIMAGRSETIASTAMILVAGPLAALAIRLTQGNGAYVAGVLWALIGIVCANVGQTANVLVAGASLSMAVLVAVITAQTRHSHAQAGFAQGG